MDARLDTLSTELYQVNVCVGHIARRQDDDDGDDDDALNDDVGDASSTNEMSTWHFYPLSLVTKRGSSFGYESSHS